MNKLIYKTVLTIPLMTGQHVEYAVFPESPLSCGASMTPKCNLLTGYSECVCDTGSVGCIGRSMLGLQSHETF